MFLKRAPIVLVLLLATAACGGSDAVAGSGGTPDDEVEAVSLVTPTGGASRAPEPVVVNGLSMVARTDPSGFSLYTRSGEVPFLTGINLGSAIPGRLPAELKVDAETWRRWFPMIAGTGVHAIRIYTLQPPYFYEELLAYNLAHPDHPLYLVHGVWVPDELMGATHDLFDPSVLDLVRADVDSAVAAVHGDAELPSRQGYGSGLYQADVSEWLVSWAFGVEMDPVTVRDSDVANVGREYTGAFVSATDDASPTEAWLAEMMDRIAGIESTYGRTMPLTFSNWPTTDPLIHPTEPLETEDMVGIDANHLVASPAWPGGLYASYHAYPYYPDFLRYEPGIADFEFNGEVDSYAGYLSKLRDHHAEAGLPVMVLEFGVPTSIGSAHNGSLGRDQGGHNEADAMAINAGLLRTQSELGLAGGFVFSWQDEWFKRTWNTMDAELPADRRQLWLNPLTNESGFGLIAMDPVTEGAAVIVDGRDDEWTLVNSQVIFESGADMREIRVVHDEAYLYVRLELADESAWDLRPIVLGFDVVPGGNGALPGTYGVGAGADTAIVVGPGHEANAFVRASNDYNDLVLGRRIGFYEVDDASLLEGSGVWNPQRMAVNRPLNIPELNLDMPMEWFQLNPLRTGSSDPGSSDFDSRTVWAAEGKVIELRLPWGMVGLSDPSSRSALVVSADGGLSTAEVEVLGITVALGSIGLETDGYSWEGWNSVTWIERPKVGLQVFLDAVAEVNEG